MNQSNTIHVLVFDDGEFVRPLITFIQKKMSLEVDYVDNGISVLSSIQENSYDIIFIDSMMPGMDGYQVCKQIRADKKNKDIPVIMLTDNDGTFLKIRGKLSGVNHYLTKPVMMDEFKDIVEKCLPVSDLSGVATTAEAKHEPKLAEKTESPKPGSPPKIEFVDVKQSLPNNRVPVPETESHAANDTGTLATLNALSGSEEDRQLAILDTEAKLERLRTMRALKKNKRKQEKIAKEQKKQAKEQALVAEKKKLKAEISPEKKQSESQGADTGNDNVVSEADNEIANDIEVTREEKLAQIREMMSQ